MSNMKKIDFLAALPDLPADWDEKINAQRAEEEEEERQREQYELRARLADNGCPIKDLERALSGDMVETKALKHAREAHEAAETIVVLAGLRGVGKTTAAAWWLVQQRASAPYVHTTYAQFVEAGVLADLDKFDNEDKARLKRLNTASALVIDDLGTEFQDGKGFFQSRFHKVINARYNSELPTLITTNLTAAMFKARYGEPITDRIRETGRFVGLEGKSMRGQK